MITEILYSMYQINSLDTGEDSNYLKNKMEVITRLTDKTDKKLKLKNTQKREKSLKNANSSRSKEMDKKMKTVFNDR